MSAWKPKPGDVGLARVHSDDLPLSITGVAGRLVDVVVTRGSREWVLAAHGDFFWSDKDRPDLEVRPLVVIDPEDREQVERVTGALMRHFGIPPSGDRDTDVRDMQAALRSLLAPPTPDEPTGLGAVVEDADGTRWVHRGQGFMTAWSRVATTTEQAHGEARGWSNIAAVRVLSEGVDQ